MSVNFFDLRCQSTTTAKLFGLCDDRTGLPAYIDTDNAENWVASVENESQKQISFIAIDNCIDIRRIDELQERSCDGMIFYPNNILFIELKSDRKNWAERGINQLSRTIEIFKANHDISIFVKKRAFLCNRKHPNFQYSMTDSMERFRSETGVRLIIEARIKV